MFISIWIFHINAVFHCLSLIKLIICCVLLNLVRKELDYCWDKLAACWGPCRLEGSVRGWDCNFISAFCASVFACRSRSSRHGCHQTTWLTRPRKARVHREWPAALNYFLNSGDSSWVNCCPEEWTAGLLDLLKWITIYEYFLQAAPLTRALYFIPSRHQPSCSLASLPTADKPIPCSPHVCLQQAATTTIWGRNPAKTVTERRKQPRNPISCCFTRPSTNFFRRYNMATNEQFRKQKPISAKNTFYWPESASGPCNLRLKLAECKPMDVDWSVLFCSQFFSGTGAFNDFSQHTPNCF